MNDLRCPMYYNEKQCEGILQLVDHGGTCLGTLEGLDQNNHAEFFVCKKCGASIYRTYKWNAWREGE